MMKLEWVLLLIAVACVAGIIGVLVGVKNTLAPVARPDVLNATSYPDFAASCVAQGGRVLTAKGPDYLYCQW